MIKTWPSSKIHEVLVDMLLDIAPDIYELYVNMYNRGINKLISQFMNAIYGNMVEFYLNIVSFVRLRKLISSSWTREIIVWPIEW